MASCGSIEQLQLQPASAHCKQPSMRPVELQRAGLDDSGVIAAGHPAPITVNRARRKALLTYGH